MGFDALHGRTTPARMQHRTTDTDMTPHIHPVCNDTPSYFSERCMECRFVCLEEAQGTPRSRAGTGSRAAGVIGAALLGGGLAAQFLELPLPADGLVVGGAVTIIVDILRR